MGSVVASVSDPFRPLKTAKDSDEAILRPLSNNRLQSRGVLEGFESASPSRTELGGTSFAGRAGEDAPSPHEASLALSGGGGEPKFTECYEPTHVPYRVLSWTSPSISFTPIPCSKLNHVLGFSTLRLIKTALEETSS